MIYIPASVLAECRAFQEGGFIKHFKCAPDNLSFVACKSFRFAVAEEQEVVCYGIDIPLFRIEGDENPRFSEVFAEGYAEGASA